MRKKKQDIRQIIETPMLGFGIVLFTLLCFLLALWTLIVIVRIVLG